MAYDYIQPAAFEADPAASDLTLPANTLCLPAEWEEPFLELYRYGKPEHKAGRIQRVPTRAINQVMRATAPDIIAVDSNATFGQAQPWLYAHRLPTDDIMNSFLLTWLRNLQHQPDDPASFRLLQQIHELVNAQPLTWKQCTVNLTAPESSPDGTALPPTHLFRLLPELIAARIAALPPYEHNGQQLAFVQVAGTTDSGAEVMSWPPLHYDSKDREGGGTKRWHYSAVIRVNLRTVPYSSTPRVHLSCSIRRWLREKVWMPTNNSVSVYLRPDHSLLNDATEEESAPERFSVAQLTWGKDSGTAWKHTGPQGMLLDVTSLERLPSVDLLIKDAERWLHGRDGITAAVTHHTRMGRHAIGAGLMPAERRRLTEWAAQALAPEFRPIAPLHRSKLNSRPMHHLEKLRPVPKKNATEEERARIAAENALRTDRNAIRRRKALAETLAGQDLSVIVLHQSDSQRDRLLSVIEDNLALTGYRTTTGPPTYRWKTDDITVRLHAAPLGELGAPLGGEKQPRAGKEHDQALRTRRSHTATRLRELIDSAPGAQLVLIELDGDDVYTKTRRRADPKAALRLGAADAGLVSQFFRPVDRSITDADEAGEDAQFRIEAAWHDGLRQTGMRFVPDHQLDGVPEDLNQLAFWLVKRRADGPTHKPQFTPVAVLIRPSERCVLGRTPEMRQWVPYPELLKGLIGRIREDDLKTAEQQSRVTAAFIKSVLAKLRPSPTVVFTRAQNIRTRWPWLKNSDLTRDSIALDDGPQQRIALYGKQLRVLRIADGTRDETAQWWAPKEQIDEGRHRGKQRAGIAKGLWVPEPGETGKDNRVFYSTADKDSKHTGISVEAAKLTPHVNEKGNSEYRPTKNASNPDLLEVTTACLQHQDDAETWAMFAHLQRMCDDDYRDVLGLPLVLHLAKLANEYGLPHDGDEVVEPEEDEQLTFDFPIG